MKKKLIPAALVLIALGGVAAALRSGGLTGPPPVKYPYVCAGCKAVVDVGELRKDYPKHWRCPPGAPSDSVVICLRCNKGWAYPVATCDTCGTQHIMHRTRDSRCPKCFPEAAQAAARAGVEVFFRK